MSYNHPDLVAHVFKLKLQELINNIYKCKVFGPVSAYVYVVEFQCKACHILIFWSCWIKISDFTHLLTSILAYWRNGQTPKNIPYCLTLSSPAWCMAHVGISIWMLLA